MVILKILVLVHSDKCQNQYKMNIFCKETQAQLELHPHLQNTSLQENVCKTLEPNLPLITPDLWLRDCHSPPPLTSEQSLSPPSRVLHSPLPMPVPAPPQLRVSNKLFDRQSRKRKRTLVEDTALPPVCTRFPSHTSVYCTQPASTNPPTNELPPPPPLYPLNMQQSLLPPPMILVPYPIMLPIPIPIPIPIPLPFLQKECDNTSKEEKNEKKL